MNDELDISKESDINLARVTNKCLRQFKKNCNTVITFIWHVCDIFDESHV